MWEQKLCHFPVCSSCSGRNLEPSIRTASLDHVSHRLRTFPGFLCLHLAAAARTSLISCPLIGAAPWPRGGGDEHVIRIPMKPSLAGSMVARSGRGRGRSGSGPVGVGAGRGCPAPGVSENQRTRGRLPRSILKRQPPNARPLSTGPPLSTRRVAA